MKHSFDKEIVIGAGNRKKLFFNLPDEIKLLEMFLGIEITDRDDTGAFFLEAIQKVLSGEEETQLVHGNITALKVMKEKTFVMDMLADDGLGNACYIETEELKKLIYVWLEELEKFNQEQKEKE